MNETLRRSKPLTIAEIGELPAFVDLQEASLVLGIGRNTGIRLVASGKFPVPAVKVGKNYRISTLALLRYLEYPIAA